MLTAGYSGMQDFRRTSASMVNLVAYLVPLFALLMGVFSLISNREYLELMVTQPVSRARILLGKFLGLLAAILAATVAGFGIPGMISSATVGSSGAAKYLAVVGYSFLLAASFVSIAILIAVILRRRLAALGTALGIWFFFVMFYDLIIMAMTLYLNDSTLQNVLVFGLLGNPVDMMRVMSLVTVGGNSMFGPAGATLVTTIGNTNTLVMLFLGVLILWIIIPLAISIYLFKRQNLT